MIPVHQTKFSDPANAQRGNCFSACLASILEISIDLVPEFHGGTWTGDLQRWLRGFGMVCLWIEHDDNKALPMVIDALPGQKIYAIVAGNSPWGPWGHATVWEFDGNGCRMIHDPHPSGDGLVTRERVYLLIETE